MTTGLLVLEEVDWSKLLHAYGRATDTPGHLRDLLQGDEAACKSAMEHLWSAIIHQGTPWTATGPVARFVAGIVFDERLDRVESLREALIRFLVAVAKASKEAGLGAEKLRQMAAFNLEPFIEAADESALYEDAEAANAFYARSILGCMEVAPVLMQVMIDGMNHADPRVRAVAAMGAVSLVEADSLADQAPAIESLLQSLAQNALQRDERCAHVLALGELGLSPVQYLADGDPSVRMCAALAPALAGDARAIDVLIETLEKYASEMDGWFVHKPPQFSMRPRFPVVARLVKQVKDFERLAAGAVAVVGVTVKSLADYDWGPLLTAAFPDGDGVVQFEGQRRFLSALVRRAELWDSKFGNAAKWFKNAGLPNDRRACAKLVGVEV